MPDDDRIWRHLGASWLILLWERLWLAAWPLLALLGLFLALALLDLLPLLGIWLHGAVLAGFLLALPAVLWFGFRRFRLPGRAEAERRLEATSGLRHRPFQTMRDRRNFLNCVRQLVTGARVASHGSLHVVHFEGREIRVGSFPIGIDYDDFARRAGEEEVARRAWNIHAGLPERHLILGVDRLDYTKGIPTRLMAIRNALRRYPDLHQKVTYIQVVVPSRVDIPKYFALKTEIEQLVGEINGEFTQSPWVPIHYIFRSLDQEELLAYYRTCEIALVTPLKDGMNLVSKEFCACSHEQNAALILSEFAGSAAQLHRGALLVNPYDIEEVADAIHQAVMMPREERRDRMRRMRRVARTQNIYWWLDAFMRAAFEKNLQDFPVFEDYVFPRRDEEDRS